MEEKKLSREQEVIISVLLNSEEVAKLLRTTYGVLACWRSLKRYPLRYVRIGRKIFYRREDVQAFIESRTDNGVSEEASGRRRRPGTKVA
jgi:Helix-turn-helix domain